MAVALIVAAGEGVRMGSHTRKQYLPLNGKPVLLHTLEVFDGCPAIQTIFLVMPPGDFGYCDETVLESGSIETPVCMVPGGATRQDSVYNGLTAIDKKDRRSLHDIVAIHDGVRPFVTGRQIEACIDVACESGACILGVPASDTLKQVDTSGCITQTVKRDMVWQAQTPQAFRVDLIRNAYRQAKQTGRRATDDASLLEDLGHPVRIVTGTRYNIKITLEEDLRMAEAICRFRMAEVD